MESKLFKLIEKDQIKGNPPSLRIIVTHKGKKLINSSWGRPARFFDVGSMTKIMVTTPLCMKLFEEKKLSLNEKVKKYLPYFEGTPVGDIVIKKLLRHDSGLEAWRPFYKMIGKIPLKEIFKKEKVRKRAQCVYSDLDFIILGWIIEEVLDMPLDEAAEIFVFKKLKMKNTFFNPKERFKKLNLFAPTKKNRKGEVFDDNTFAMGGVAGHAGLFSTAEDVDIMGRTFLGLYFGKPSPLIKASTLKYFTKRAVSAKKGDWGLGFTLPSRPISTAGTKVSSRAFGHVGYTGTSLWVDPKRKAVVAVLSNGTYPNKTNEAFKYLRREIHDGIWEIIDGKG